MSSNDLLYLWSDSLELSITIWFFMTIFAMYLGRSTAHKLILCSVRGVKSAMRLFAKSLGRFEKRMEKRNRDVILNTGIENSERKIEREFHRVKTIIAKDLSAYPALHRKFSDTIEKIESDYHEAAETPPQPPNWLEAIETIANLPNHGDPVIAKILDGIQDTIEKSQQETLKAYQKSSIDRHQHLKSILPACRTLGHTLTEVKSTIDNMCDRSDVIDKQMAKYEQIRAAEDQAVRTLSSSSLTQFFISGLVLIIATMGGLVNFQLIALPMSEMVGGMSQVGAFRVADIAALVIIMLEIAMGLFLLESLRITHLFQVIGSMDDKMRKRMVIITFTILAILASVEASLAYMRDLLAMDREALSQSLSGVSVVEAEFRWIPSMGQMVMGFILPFTLAFVAIPLESFIHSTRTLIGIIAVGSIRAMAFVCRLIGNLTYQFGKIIVGLYDLIIFLPLQLENLVKQTKNMKKEKIPELNESIDLDETVEVTKGVSL